MSEACPSTIAAPRTKADAARVTCGNSCQDARRGNLGGTSVVDQASVPCPKCGRSNRDSIRFCVQCHFPLYFVCSACAHKQRAGGVCEACGVDFDKLGMTQLARMKLESERA